MTLVACVFARGADAAICDADEQKVHVSLGVDMQNDNLPGGPEYLGLPGGPGTAAYTDFFFLTEDGQFYTDFIRHDHGTNTIVDIPTSGNNRNYPGDVTIDAVGGDIRYEQCLPENWKGGLALTVYENAGKAVSLNITALHPREANGDVYALGVQNEANTLAIAGNFNAGDADAEQFLRLATEYAGTTFPRKFAENAITLFQTGLTDKPMRGDAFLYDCANAFVEGDNVFLTGTQASCDTPSGVIDVRRTNGTRVDNNGVVDVDANLNQTLWQRTDYGTIPFTVLDGRGDITVDVNGTVVTADFNYANGLGSLDKVIEVVKGGQVVKRVENDDLNTSLSDGTYTINSWKVTPQGNVIGEHAQTISVSTQSELVTILGVDTDSNDTPDNENVNGSLERAIALECERDFYIKFITEPTGNYSWTGNAPDWADTSNGEIFGQPTGAACGKTHTFTYTVHGPDNNDSVDVTYEVGAEKEKPLIVGIDIDGNGTVDVPDADRDGALDSVIDIDCNFPIPYEHTLIVEPEDNYTAFGQSIPQNMVLSQGLLRITYDPDCSDAGQTFVPSFYVSGPPGTSDWIDIQYRVQ